MIRRAVKRLRVGRTGRLARAPAEPDPGLACYGRDASDRTACKRDVRLVTADCQAVPAEVIGRRGGKKGER